MQVGDFIRSPEFYVSIAQKSEFKARLFQFHQLTIEVFRKMEKLESISITINESIFQIKLVVQLSESTFRDASYFSSASRMCMDCIRSRQTRGEQRLNDQSSRRTDIIGENTIHIQEQSDKTDKINFLLSEKDFHDFSYHAEMMTQENAHKVQQTVGLFFTGFGQAAVAKSFEK